MKKIIFTIFLMSLVSISSAKEDSVMNRDEYIQNLITHAPKNRIITISKVNSYEADAFLEKTRNFLASVRGITRYQAKVSFIPSWASNMRNLERILATESESARHEEATLYRGQLKDWLNKLLVGELSAILNKPIRWIDGVVIVPK